ncbi:DUF4259 domain-containing protein [Cellulophaga fucicola]|uniref:DUF4259 domain-containing protein n=1 Tax=Cellulophaga fucicola TaxID=76595 RepID=A0A1K1NYP4_9FLAO|nr:DUF4259 domain-containing protein [Cellulophaga fucicola]SFW40325.1 protein of unknown function [Cellulophaga fucicola]
MGAWDYGIFDDDTAYDFTDEIKTDAKTFFKSSFESAINSDYLEYDECHMVTVSAAYLDNYLNGTKYRTDSEEEKDESNVNMFSKLNLDLKLDDLKEPAIKALDIVISEKSELNELWSDNEELYPKWKRNLEELISRLK